MAHVTALNAATLAALAYAPPAPANVRVVTKNLDNDTTLEWNAGDAPAGTKYEVVWRELAASDWQFFEQGSAGSYSVTLPISKDNVIFGVCAVDAEGHRSPAVAPMPER